MPHPSIDRLFENLESSLKKTPDSLFVKENPIYIYGAGNVGKDLFRVLTKNGIPVNGFFDRNAKSDATWEGVTILKPDSQFLNDLQRKQSKVVIGIFNRETEMLPITDYLNSLGFGKVISFLEVHDHFAEDLGDKFWLTSRRSYLNDKERISSTYELWSDDASRDLFTSILQFRFEQNYSVLPAASWDDQYFPKGLPSWSEPMRFIDCGAYDGDTLRQLKQEKIQVEAIAAFEPDSANYNKLVKTAHGFTESIGGAVSLFPCGVSSETTQIRFLSGQGTGSHASPEGNGMIQCVSLDEAVPQFRPTLIKMDIEGAEYSTLLGAHQMIVQSRPGLAISVYHCAEHLWTIPLLIQKWMKGGRHYLRSHAFNGFELIYYWIP